MTAVDFTIADKDPGARLNAMRYHLPDSDVLIGPVGHLAAERARLRDLTWQHFDVKALGATVGAELSGIDLRAELADEVIAEIRQALLAYKVIFFRNQPVSAAEHVAFARRFGDLEIHPFLPANATTPEIVRFEKSADVGGYENGWHHDVTWRECPSFGAILHSIAVPPTGGDTVFSDMCAAYDGLDAELKVRLEGMTATHDYMNAFSHQVKPEDREAMRAKFPVVHHPVVCTHAETGRKFLYVNRYFVTGIDGVSREESTALINLLCRQAEFLEYQVRFHWEPDSIAFWDNRAVQHYAASDYWPDVRIMERVSIIGSRPQA